MNIKLKGIKLKTLLLYPPDNLKIYPDEHVPFGIATLAGFLNNLEYYNIELVDLRYRYYKPSRIKNIIPNFLKEILSDPNFRNIKKKIENILCNVLNEGFIWSLNSIISSGIYKTFNKKSRFYKLTIHLLNEKNPDLIGFSIHSPRQLFYALQISKIVKTFQKNIHIIFGGPIITKNIDHIIYKKRLSKIVDGFMIGDGEEPLAKLIYNLANSKDLKNIPNFYYKNRNYSYNKSNISFSVNQKHIVMPNFDGLKIEYFPLCMSIGCPWSKCTFCTYKVLNRNYGYCKCEKSIKIITSLIKKYGPKEFLFVDDGIPPPYLKKFSEKILEKKMNISWSCKYLCLDRRFIDESIPKFMKKAGCISVSFGLESASPRILKLMKKIHSPDTAIKILESFKKAGIRIMRLYVMFGFPTETKEEALMTLNFLKNNKHLYDKVYIQQFSLEEHTDIYNEPTKFGISHINTSDKDYGDRLSYRYKIKKGMTQEEAKIFTEYAKDLLFKS